MKLKSNFEFELRKENIFYVQPACNCKELKMCTCCAQYVCGTFCFMWFVIEIIDAYDRTTIVSIHLSLKMKLLFATHFKKRVCWLFKYPRVSSLLLQKWSFSFNLSIHLTFKLFDASVSTLSISWKKKLSNLGGI
jgi:hypothetical protein